MVSCTVCMIAKNEGPYLLEWVAYYRSLGFSKIVVYENNSTDRSAVILRKLAARKYIEHRTWKLGKYESPQITAYEDMVGRAQTDWLLFVDCDEFLVMNKGSLSSMLEYIHPQADIGAIGVNWRVFGSSSNLVGDSRPVIERFVRASEANFEANKHLKSFLRVGSVGEAIDMHLSDVKGRVVFADGSPLGLESRGRASEIKFDVAQVNHYFGKTPEEYAIKMLRGQGGAGENNHLKYWYSQELFHYHDRNEIEDLGALAHLDNVRTFIRENA